jgi:hypothetical protein
VSGLRVGTLTPGVLTEPRGKTLAVQGTGSQVEDEPLLVANGRVNFDAVELKNVAMAACPTRLLPSRKA